MTLHERFEVHEGEFLQFERIQDDARLSNREDLCAFLYLARLFPDDKNILAGASHDVVYFEVSDEQAATLTENDIIYLSRCGVHCEEDTDALAMFV